VAEKLPGYIGKNTGPKYGLHRVTNFVRKSIIMKKPIKAKQTIDFFEEIV
jgi:hypothetical protein